MFSFLFMPGCFSLNVFYIFKLIGYSRDKHRGCCRCATDFGKSTFSMGLLRKKLILLVIFLKSCNFSEFFVKSCKLWDFVGQSVKSSDDRLFYRFRMNVEAFKSQSVDKSVVNKGNILTNFSEKLLN